MKTKERFVILNRLADLFEAAAFILTIVNLTGLVIWFFSVFTSVEQAETAHTALIIGASLASAFMTFIVLRLASELCRWLVDVGEDVRRSAESAEKTHAIVDRQDRAWQKSNPDSSPTGTMPSSL